MADRDQHASRGFDVLSDETRVGILMALAERLREHPEDPTIGFSDLRRLVGVRDSGNFSYHLGKLDGRFVTKTPAGYRIGPAGHAVVAALITGVYGEQVQLGPVELDDECPACSRSFSANYENGLLLITCPEEHTFKNPLPPGAVDDRSLAEVIDLWTHKTRRDLELALEHVCPFCYAFLDWSPDFDPNSELAEFDTQCSRCGVRIEIPIVVSVLRHPTVASFYHAHGIDVRSLPFWSPELYEPVTVQRSGDRIEVRIDLDNDRLDVTLDESLSVLDVDQ